MDTTSYLALSRQAALQRHMATDREQSRQCHDHGLSRRAHGVRGDPASGRPPAGRLRAGRRPCARPVARADRRRPAIRSISRSTATAISPSRPMAGRGYGRAGRLEVAPDGRLVDSNGRAAARRRRQRRSSWPRTRQRSRSPATARSSGGNGPIARDRRRGFANEQALRRDRRRAVHRDRAGAAGRGRARRPGCARRLQRRSRSSR